MTRRVSARRRVATAAAVAAVSVAASVVMSIPAPARAQEVRSEAPAAGAPESAARPWRFGMWVAAAPNSAFITRLGEWRRDFYMVGVRAERVIASGAVARLHHVVEAIPVAVSTNNVDAWENLCQPRPKPLGRGTTIDGCTALTSASVYGVGLAPLGLELRLLPRRAAQLAVGVTGGALVFTRPVPDPEATRFNFTADAGGAVLLRLGGRRWLRLGYRYHHTSNAGTGRVNPGLNAHVGYVGITSNE